MPSLLRFERLGKALFFAVGCAFLWVAAPACTPSAGAYCDKKCDCTSCTDAQRNACVDAIAASQKVAANKGCSGQFDAAFSCVNANTSCSGTTVEQTGCEAENAALSKCAPGSGVGDPCQLYADGLIAKYKECGIDIGGGGNPGTTTCTGALAVQASCLSTCTDKIDCPCTLNPSGPGCTISLKPYTDCVTSCLQ